MTDRTRTVFVIHGRNIAMRDALYDFLRTLDLVPLPFETAANEYVAIKKGPPYVGEIVRYGIERSQAAIVLATADECVFTLPSLRAVGDPFARWAARPNVWFEAGMAFQLAADRMIIALEHGVDLPTDVGGIQYFRLDNTLGLRSRLRERLRAVGCALGAEGDDWRSPRLGGDFDGARIPRPTAKDPWQ